MLLRLLAGALVVGTIFVLSPERRQPARAGAPTTTLPSAEGALAAIPGSEAVRGAIADRVARSLLTDGVERVRQALPGADAKPEAKSPRGAAPKP